MKDKNLRLVVLDDDPTGIQTVHGCRLLTEWNEETVGEALDDPMQFFYILTNTRAMTRTEATAVVESVMDSVLRANQSRGYKLIFLSRSDSCLRGHFPLEIEVMEKALASHGIKVWHPIPFAPALIEAGRVTIDGAHYMIDGEKNIPLSETEFARDNVFGYKSSVLNEYIEEKGGRKEDYEIVDAQDYCQLYEYAEKLFSIMSHFDGAMVIRSSSSLPKAISGIPDKPLLDKSILRNQDSPGIFIVGSHVQKTTRQLECLLLENGVAGVELDVRSLLMDCEATVHQAIAKVAKVAGEGLTPVVYTSREEIRLSDADARQHLGQKVSQALLEIVRQLPFVPSYIVAKGGITSHDILTKGLGVRSAKVLGQIVTNVPCVMTQQFPYIIFPGNVGDDGSLLEVYKKLGLH